MNVQPIYQLAVTAEQMHGFLDRGIDLCGGFAVDAQVLSGVTDSRTLRRLMRFTFTGTSLDTARALTQPLFMLTIPSTPFLSVRAAVGPLQEHAVFGGIIFPPLDARGILQAHEPKAVQPSAHDESRTPGVTVRSPLLWIQPTRLPTGSQLWKFFPHPAVTPELLGTYTGLEHGWRTPSGDEHAIVPSPFIGPVVRREWGIVPVDVHTDDDGKPVAVTMVSPTPPTEAGFHQLPNKLWVKRLTIEDERDITEMRAMGTYRGMPVQILRSVFSDPARSNPNKKMGNTSADAQVASERTADSSAPQAPQSAEPQPGQPQLNLSQHLQPGILAHITPMIVDSAYAQALGFQIAAPGLMQAFVPFTDLEGRYVDVATARSWELQTAAAATSTPSKALNMHNSGDLVAAILKMLTTVIPHHSPTWRSISIDVQLVGASIAYTGVIQFDDETTLTLNHIPTAVFHYLAQLKILMYRKDSGTFYAAHFDFQADGQVEAALYTDEESPLLSHASADAWYAELRQFPRNEASIPLWMRTAAR
ncbi:MAG: hypothetical protein SPI12_00590 [Actinomycetaceae bacterium]|nr:hypothetical protein [Actinomycetaceae bacterium]MDY6082348.1 hypothetical protein [Actinomycetaceae bacterium]